MGETRYPLRDKDVVRFGYDDYRYTCLCTFPVNYFNKQLNYKDVESLALLGASLCLYVNGGLEERHPYSDEYIIPDCIPKWIRDEIRRIVGDYPEEYDGSAYDSDEDDVRIKRLKEIKKWCKQQIKDIKKR